MQEKMDQLQRELREKNKEGEPSSSLIDTPFTDDVMSTHYPQDLRIPLVRTYNGRSDPQDHINMYYGSMLMLGVCDAVICRAFFATLVGRAAEWFRSLEPHSIANFSQLADKFVRRFAANKSRKKPYTYLNKVKQDVGEALSAYLSRWEREVDQVEPMEDHVAVHAFLSSLRSGALYYDLIVKPPKTYEEAITRARHHADATEANTAKRREEQPVGRDKGHDQRRDRPRFRQRGRTGDGPRFTPLNKPLVEVLQFAEQCNLVHPPEPVPEGADRSKYCAFHKVRGHDTTECIALRLIIEQLIQSGELEQFVRKDGQDKGKAKKNVWRRNQKEQSKAPSPPESHDDKATGKKPVIHVIYGGPEGGDSSRQRKQWARNLYIGSVQSELREKKKRTEPIFFTDDDLPIHGETQSDSLVVTMDINGTDVQRVLVDTGSSVNILYFDVFTRLGLSTDKLAPLRTPLSGFTGDSIEAEGIISLNVEMGTHPNVLKTTMDFVVVKLKCVHNAILGRPGITQAAAVISMSHLCLKFHTPNGIGVLRGDQRVAR
ncbi:uncharacterized protein LOC116023427 [Ipomoea triloba]|uniref:uncharacterized protein LOC116023427 n=1 Tax=Ipomoea triloba TaxID=35885 RepID=UPI00125D6BDA|nr:uncharacterized protein LOC116023427 [Ipomoea triloba]